MGFLNSLFGFRWSLYIVRNEKQLIYAMHEHSVIGMVGYIMGYFANGGRPVEPWNLYLNFNRKHQSILLRPEHFTPDGENVTAVLIREIESIDPGWRVKGGEPVFVEVASKKRIKISTGRTDIHTMLANIGKPREITFYSVMNGVFGTSLRDASR